MASNAKPFSGYIPGIDGLRAVAVLSVLLFHMREHFLPGGFAGVDVFFVISGYVVSASLAHRPAERLGNFLLGFYTRRIVRIFPALLLCVLVTGIATALVVPQSWLSDTTSKTGLAAVFGLSNIALIKYSDGYFGARADFNPFTHTWSLAVEEQFYLIFPPMFYAWSHYRAVGGTTGKLARFMLPAALLVSLAYCAYQTSARADFAYYLLPSRFWELACGAMLFRLHDAGRCLPGSPRQSGILLTVGGLLIGLAFAWADTKAFPFPWAIPAVLGSMLVISGSVGDVACRSLPVALMGSRPMIYLGKISYSLYLWHWPVLVLLRWTTGLDSAIALLMAAGMSFALAVFSYHWVEQGSWWRRRIVGWKPGRTAVCGVAFVLLCAVCLHVVQRSQSQISLSATRDEKTWYPKPWPSNPPVVPVAGELAGRKIFVWGDSHAGAYSTMLQMMKERTGLEVISIWQGGCPVAGLGTSKCKPQTSETISTIKSKAAAGDLVFLASLRVPRLADQWEVFTTPTIVAPNPALDEGRLKSLREADELVTTLEKAGLRVIIDAPKPVFKSPPFRCSDSFNDGNPVCAAGFEVERAYLESHRKPVVDALKQLRASHPALVVWDPFPVLCPGSTCSAFDGFKPLFFDGDHLSAYGNRVLYPSFLDLVTSTVRDGGARMH
jgi:peptidoglycan/LPS O-acetylase OafA/YrhL